MSNPGKDCPDCHVDIGTWSVFRAFWPSKIKCPHCGARLSYKHYALPFTVICIAYLCSLLFLLNHYYEKSQSFTENILILAAFWYTIAFVAWAPFDLLFTLYERKFGTLSLTRKR